MNMFLEEILRRLIAFHAGTPPVVSQTVLTLMLVVIGIVLVGIGFGFMMKNKEGLLQHRWVLSISLALTLGAVFLVMLPTVTRYYIDPDVEVFSSLSIATIIHGIIGVPPIMSAVIYAFGDMPTNVKKWMRITASFWVASTLTGIVLFLIMMEIV